MTLETRTAPGDRPTVIRPTQARKVGVCSYGVRRLWRTVRWVSGEGMVNGNGNGATNALVPYMGSLWSKGCRVEALRGLRAGTAGPQS